MSLARTLSILLVFSACGSSPRPDVDEAFHRIQVHEATIAHRASDVEACGEQAACAAVDETCSAAEAICSIAAELDDPDARARCLLAERRCPRESVR